MRSVCGLQSPPGSPLQFLAHPWNSHLSGPAPPPSCVNQLPPLPSVCSLSFPGGTLTDLLLEASFKGISSPPVILTVSLHGLTIACESTRHRHEIQPWAIWLQPPFLIFKKNFLKDFVCLFWLHHKACELLNSSSPSRGRTCASCVGRQIRTA